MKLQSNLERFAFQNGVQRGLVESVESGAIHVRDARAPQNMYACQFLRTSSAPPPEIKPGDEVLLAFGEAAGEAFVLGIVEPYLPKQDRLASQFNKAGTAPSTTTLQDDVVRIKAGKGLVIECGQGTIIITQDGRVQIKGNEILSRARGMNKIKGAGIDLN